MTISLSDWEDELVYEPEEEYQALLRALQRTQEFGLLFVECSPAKGEQIIRRVQTDLTTKSVGTLTFEVALDDGNVYKRVKQTLIEHPVDVLFIQGLDKSLTKYEDDLKQHLGWSDQEIQTYSWRGVPPVMLNLNQQRENFRDSFQSCLVFLIPGFVLEYMIHRAPDFFDWRSGLFKFPRESHSLKAEAWGVYFNQKKTDEYKYLSS